MEPSSPEWLVSPEPHASPAAVRPRDPGSVRWYLPTWGERLRFMGWRNLLWLPPLLFVVLTAWAVSGGRFFGMGSVGIWIAWWKPLVLLVGLPFSVAIARSRTALRDRRDPFCIHCGYSLVGLEEGHACPECGEAISHALCREYQRDPQWFIERYHARHATPKADAPFEAGEHRVASTDGT